MKKKICDISSDHDVFSYHVQDVKKIVQDTIFHIKLNHKKKKFYDKKFFFEQELHSHYFQDFVSENLYFLHQDPICYVRNSKNLVDVKKFKKGKYIPEVVLDLHGVNLYQAKKALGMLIAICLKKNFFCANVIHGYGKNILKKNIPIWLIQNPNILAFHRAPKIFGFDAAILIFIKKNS
ncbi:endonuclease SmrB [Buchnera aphidicola]|uniref:endonuclease SmrB n=1 Tax=Buchnera aphidicola TaxID=9 RepID=UPI0031B69064